MRKLLGALAVAGLLVALAPPASAGDLAWDDKADDATAFYVLTSTPLPSDPALDVVKVTITSDAKKLTWTAKVKKLAPMPTYGAGYFFRFNFTWAEEAWTLRARKDTATGTGVHFRYAGDQVGTDLPCKDCKATFDEKASAVVVEAPIASLVEGVKAADSASGCPACRTGEAPLPALKKGDKWTGLGVIAQRYYGRLTMTADDAPAPAEASFTL